MIGYISAVNKLYCQNIVISLNAIEDEHIHINKLKDFFSEKKSFSTKELEAFFRSKEPDIPDTTINWRIRHLVELGVIKRIGRGVYSLGESQKYTPQLDQPQKKLFKKLQVEFSYSNLCMWDTSTLNQFMLHQPFRFMTIIEADNDSVDSVFYKLQDLKASVFLGTDTDMIDRYGSSEKRIVVVKLLVSEAPTQKVDGVITVTLEKILVDLFCDAIIFSAYQGNERSIIYKNAFNDYTINQNKLLRYAQRRGRRDDIKEYLDDLGLLKIETNHSI